MFFSVITKNFNWEILTKNLVTILRGVRGSQKTNTFGGDYLKKEVGQFADLRGWLAKKGRGCFWDGVDTPMQTMKLKILAKWS